MKRDRLAKDFRTYNMIMNNVWKFLTTLLVGALFGYLVKRNGPDGNNYMLFIIIIFFIIGVINFFKGILKENKLLLEREERRKQLEEKEKKSLDEED